MRATQAVGYWSSKGHSDGPFLFLFDIFLTVLAAAIGPHSFFFVDAAGLIRTIVFWAWIVPAGISGLLRHRVCRNERAERQRSNQGLQDGLLCV
jgi:hypothetical protein